MSTAASTTDGFKVGPTAGASPNHNRRRIAQPRFGHFPSPALTPHFIFNHLQLKGGTYESVQNYYGETRTHRSALHSSVSVDAHGTLSGKVLSSSKDLKTSACTSSSKPSPTVLDALRKVPLPVIEKFYGCGTPVSVPRCRRTRNTWPLG